MKCTEYVYFCLQCISPQLHLISPLLLPITLIICIIATLFGHFYTKGVFVLVLDDNKSNWIILAS